MAHERPCREVLFIKSDCTLKVNYSLVMVTTERVVISNGTACLRPIFVIIEDVVGQIGKLAEILLDIEDI